MRGTDIFKIGIKPSVYLIPLYIGKSNIQTRKKYVTEAIFILQTKYVLYSNINIKYNSTPYPDIQILAFMIYPICINNKA